MAGCDLKGHFNRSDPTSRPPRTAWQMSPGGPPWTRKKTSLSPLKKKWKHNEHVTCTQLAHVVSDSLLIQIRHAGTVADMWRTIAEFNHKGQMVQVDLHHRMMEKQVSEMDDIHAHLDDMALSHEQLSGMGIAIHDKDYMSMVLMSLQTATTCTSKHLQTLHQQRVNIHHPQLYCQGNRAFRQPPTTSNCDPKPGQKDSILHMSDT